MRLGACHDNPFALSARLEDFSCAFLYMGEEGQVRHLTGTFGVGDVPSA